MLKEKIKQLARPSSLSRKFMVWLVLLTLFVMVIFGALNYMISMWRLNHELDNQLSQYSSTLTGALAEPLWQVDWQVIKNISREQPFVKLLALLRVRNNFGELAYEFDNTTAGRDYAFATSDVYYGETHVGTVEIALDRNYIAVASQSIIRSTSVIILAVLLTVYILSFFIARSIARPIDSIAKVARKIAQGDWSQRVPISGSDEVGQLATTFNTMVKKIQATDRVKSDFITVASHQLRTPLSIVNLYTDALLAEKDSNLNPRERNSVSTINKATKNMVGLVNELLEAAQLQRAPLPSATDSIKLTSFVQTIIDDITPLAHAQDTKVRFENHADSDLSITTDKKLLHQVISNVLDNAIMYRKANKPGKIRVRLSQYQDDVVIAVHDKGISIPKRDQPHIFEKFYRADNAMKQETDRSGLGLYVARTILRGLGGRIWFRSDKSGTEFFIALPIRKAKGDSP